MGTALGWLTGLGGIALCLTTLAGLMVPIAPPPLPPVLVTATVGGLLAGWALQKMRVSPFTWALAAALGLAAVPLAAGPDTADSLRQAWELFRYAVPPVPAVPALIGITAAMMWLLGMVAGAAATSRHLTLAALPPLGTAVFLLVLDRAPTPWWALAAIALLLGIGLLADRGLVRISEMLPAGGSVLAASSLALLLTLALGGLVPQGGLTSWRNTTGSGAGVGSGAAFDLFVGMHRDLIEASSEPAFQAITDGAGTFYWSLITLADYDGERWTPGALTIGRASGSTWEDPRMLPYGETQAVVQDVTISSLQESLLPHLYSPTGFASDDEVLLATLQARQDGSLLLAARTRPDLTYRVESQVPTATLADLATAAGLPPIFSQAAAAGRFSPSTRPGGSRELPAPLRQVYTRLPSDLPDELTRLARAITAGVETDLEKAVLLETFFRDPANRFAYDLSTSGHDSPTLAAWLTDTTSPLYRRGYCEQYAAAMAVLARAVGVPSRVVLGFAPGEAIGPGVVEVQKRHRHAWVEIWLVGGGWTRFDPTPRGDGPASTSSQLAFDPRQFLPPGTPASIPVIGETGEDEPTPDRGPTTPADQQSGAGLSLPLGPIFLTLLGMVALLAIFPTWKWARRGMRRRRWRRGDTRAAWREVSDRLSDLGVARRGSQTMVEFANGIDPAFAAVAHRAGAGFYGGKSASGLTPAMERAEAKLKQIFSTRRRLLAWLSPRSMRPGSGLSPSAPR
jgi:hypothetical protein